MMGEYANSKVRAKVRVTPDQVEALRSAYYATGADYLQQRNEAIITTMYDTGLRVGELVQLDIEFYGIQLGALPPHRPSERLPEPELTTASDPRTR